jgi:hypothetical protein
MRFELSHLLRNGPLRDAQLIRGCTETEAAACCIKSTQTVERGPFSHFAIVILLSENINTEFKSAI